MTQWLIIRLPKAKYCVYQLPKKPWHILYFKEIDCCLSLDELKQRPQGNLKNKLHYQMVKNGQVYQKRRSGLRALAWQSLGHHRRSSVTFWILVLLLWCGLLWADGTAQGTTCQNIHHNFLLGRLDLATKEWNESEKNLACALELREQINWAQCRKAIQEQSWPEALRLCRELQKTSKDKITQEHFQEFLRASYLESYALENLDKNASCERYAFLLQILPNASNLRNKCSQGLRRLQCRP